MQHASGCGSKDQWDDKLRSETEEILGMLIFIFFWGPLNPAHCKLDADLLNERRDYPFICSVSNLFQKGYTKDGLRWHLYTVLLGNIEELSLSWLVENSRHPLKMAWWYSGRRTDKDFAPCYRIVALARNILLDLSLRGRAPVILTLTRKVSWYTHEIIRQEDL